MTAKGIGRLAERFSREGRRSVAAMALVAFLWVPAVYAGEEASIGISGFGDFYGVARQSGEGRYEIGQVEVGLETDITGKVAIGAAIAFDGAAFGLGAFTVDFRLAGSEDGHFRPAARHRRRAGPADQRRRAPGRCRRYPHGS